MPSNCRIFPDTRLVETAWLVLASSWRPGTLHMILMNESLTRLRCTTAYLVLVLGSALGELRAAHNRISSLPATLAKNVALRILDVGHNNIESWSDLEEVGKVLTALVQITLAGNPVCVNGKDQWRRMNCVRHTRSSILF